MRNRWLVVIVVASLCLNAAVVGTYVFRRNVFCSFQSTFHKIKLY